MYIVEEVLVSLLQYTRGRVIITPLLHVIFVDFHGKLVLPRRAYMYVCMYIYIYHIVYVCIHIYGMIVDSNRTLEEQEEEEDFHALPVLISPDGNDIDFSCSYEGGLLDGMDFY